ncbi:MAG: hypothetical protein U5K84_09925 [Alkalibacterium sp.]|nr:hypothetical protein [Alkalibacterium sp.]
MTTSSQYERFNSAFNRLDRAIIKKLHLSNNEHRNGFSNMINKGRNNGDKLISSYYSRLKVINDLRNTITHASTTDEPIAYPSNSIIEEVNTIASKISHPEKS